MVWFDIVDSRKLKLVDNEHDMKIVGNVKVILYFLSFFFFLLVLKRLNLIHGVV